ncbi:hypothetical protein [Sinomonas mesophila]|uniref:hypothetical protein n=1 Tax=Sinomonas mesophila TaxID=1531955 RepID=UPI0009857251|nr:hypothetical protein [Sinomonas mesophila]
MKAGTADIAMGHLQDRYGVWGGLIVAKKMKARGRKASSGRADGGRRPTSLVAARASRAVDALASDFMRWFEADFGPAEEGLACLEVVTSLVAAYFEKTGAVTATAFEPGPLEDLLGELADEADDEVTPLVVLDMLHRYVDFLYGTGRWSGSEDDYAQVHALVGEGGPLGSRGPVIHVPSLTEDEQAESFASLPLVQRARALLGWLGGGRPVTGTGGLRLADLEEAAACAGERARGVRKRSQEALAAAADGGYALAQSMWDLPLLSRLWTALAAADMVQIRATKAVPRATAERFLTGTASEQLEQSRALATEYFSRVVESDLGATPGEAAVAAMKVGILAAAASETPPEMARLRAVPDHAPEEERFMARYVVHSALADLLWLTDVGLLEMDEHIRVPPALVQCVGAAFKDEFDLTMVYL